MNDNEEYYANYVDSDDSFNAGLRRSIYELLGEK